VIAVDTRWGPRFLLDYLDDYFHMEKPLDWRITGINKGAKLQMYHSYTSDELCNIFPHCKWALSKVATDIDVIFSLFFMTASLEILIF